MEKRAWLLAFGVLLAACGSRAVSPDGAAADGKQAGGAGGGAAGAGGTTVADGGGTGGRGGAGGGGAGGGAGGGGGARDAGLGGADGGTACATAAVGVACAAEGATCSNGCTDVCSFCNLLRCTNGRWAQVEVAPAPCFACGPTLRCQIAKDMCTVTVGGAAGLPASYRCSAIPDRCSATPTCACIGGAAPACQESGPGQITFTIYAP